MRFILVIVLSLQVSVGYSLTSLDSSQKLRSHNLLKLDKSNDSAQRPVRCTPCEKDTNLRRPISNHLDPEYRGNGADNLGYDWSPMAWGGLAFPRKSNMGGMRDSRMMLNEGGRSQGNIQVICDTCRAYWDSDGRDGGSSGRGGNRGRQFDMSGDQKYYGGQPGYWEGNKRLSEEYETRVMSPTVGVLVKPGSRIAYIPSRSGEMFWDGISGGGTRWDGFSNGISWIGGNTPEWDRSGSEPRDGTGAGEDSLRRGSDYPYVSNAFGPWDNQKRPSNWRDNSGRGYYFTNGVPNDIDPQWRDRGYASNWHYGSTNQDGWNGSNMKWNYGEKQWTDNERAANRFYFNSPQDRTYGASVGHRRQYGNQYPNYQPAAGYPSNLRPQPPRLPGDGFRPNDRFPSNFQQENFGNQDKTRPWDYTSKDPFEYQRPRPRPEWSRPTAQSYPTPGNQVDSFGKFPGNRGYEKFSPSDKSDYEKPWNRPSSYGPSQPVSSGNFPYGGNRYPEEPSGGSGHPSYPAGGNHLFFPNEGIRQPNYPNIGSRPGESRPAFSGGNRKPGEYSSSGNQIGTFSGDDGRPLAEYPGGTRPPVIYTGGRPSNVGDASGGYIGSGSSSGGYPTAESSAGEYPNDVRPAGMYLGGNRPSGYPNGGTFYPSGISRPGRYPTDSRYPESGSRPTGYPGSGDRPDKYFGSGGSPTGYPGSGDRPDKYFGSGVSPTGYPSGSGASYSQSDGLSGGGGSYSSGSSKPGFYTNEGYPSSGHFGGQPTGYPGFASGGRPAGYAGVSNKPSDYPSGNIPNIPNRHQYPYPGAQSAGNKNPPKGYYTGFITELNPNDGQFQYGTTYPNYFGSNYPGDKNFYPGKDRDKYFNGGGLSNGYSFGEKNRYPAYSEDRYSIGGNRDGNYPTGSNDRDRDKFYYGQGNGKGKYSGGYPSNHRYPNGGGDEFDRNQGSSNNKNSWNYGQNEHKDGIYRRSGGSYPPYKGGQYFTSSYLASMSTTTGSIQGGTEPKTQSVTKADEVTQPTSNSS